MDHPVLGKFAAIDQWVTAHASSYIDRKETAALRAQLAEALDLVKPLLLKTPAVVSDATQLAPEHITYDGWFTVPQGSGEFAASFAALSGRVVDGVPTLFLSGKTAQALGNENVYEISIPSDLSGGAVASIVHDWGSPRATYVDHTGGHTILTYGFHWDEEDQRLWVTHGLDYNGDAWNDCGHSIGVLDAGTGAIDMSGPWRSNYHALKTKYYTYAVPDDVAAAMGGRRLASGAPMTAGRAGSMFSPGCLAWAPHDESTPPDDNADLGSITIDMVPLLDSDLGAEPYDDDSNVYTRLRRPTNGLIIQCGWNNYGVVNGNGHEPQKNTTQDGSGCTVDGDLCGAFEHELNHWEMEMVFGAAWVDTPIRTGLVFLGQHLATIPSFVSANKYPGTVTSEGLCHTGYAPANTVGGTGTGHVQCVHGQVDERRYNTSGSPGPMATSMAPGLWIYSKAQLLAIAEANGVGAVVPDGVQPVHNEIPLYTLAHGAAGAFAEIAQGWPAYGTVYWDKVNKKIYWPERNAVSYPFQLVPKIHVFSVDC
jgi:hypothetical protein